MNDRFKFRVWDNRDKEYLDPENYLWFYMTADGKCHIGYENSVTEDIEEYPQSSFIIEQCTGLKDKKGELIYEGDIITTAFEYETPSEYNTYAVKWCKAYAGEMFCSVDERGEPIDFYGGIPCVEYCRVIGNVHEHEVAE